MTNPFTPVFSNPQHVKLLEDYLSDRALEPNDFPEGLIPISDRNILSELGYNAVLAAGRPFFFLQYLDPYGNPYLDETGKNPYRLARFLGKETLWKSDKPPPKMVAQNGRPNVLHFEPIQEDVDGSFRDWHNLKDGSIVVHVESMIKARVVSKWTGFPSIGYNGVNSYTSSKRGVELIHSQYDVDFTRLRHVILFDSNVWKPEVSQARLGLMFKLKHVLGCRDIAYVDLPKVGGEDVGPDDYIAKVGPEKLMELIMEGATDYKGDEHDELIAELQERAVYCTRSSLIIDRGDKQVRSEQKAASFYAPIHKKVLKRGTTVTVPAFPLWRESKERVEVANPGFEYLGGEFLEKDDGVYYNLYERAGVWPQGTEGNECSPMIEHLSKMVSEEDLRRLRSYLKFLKYTNRKPTSFPVLFSDKRGVGKGWFTLIVKKLIGGKNVLSGNSLTFASRFNSELEARRVIIVNELQVKGGDKNTVMNNIKTFIADPTTRIERKGMDSYESDTSTGLIVTANALEDVPNDGFEDRRIWYVDCHRVDYEDESAYWNPLYALLENDAALRSFAKWVEDGEDVDFSTWRPPLDENKKEAILASTGTMGVAAYELLENLRGDDNGWICMSLATIRHLMSNSVPSLEKISDQALAASLKRGGVGWKTSSKKYGKNGEQKRVWIVNEDKFEKIEHVGAEVNGEVARAAAHFVKTKY